MSKFNPLHDGLGIPDDGRPVDYYRLLDLATFEARPEAIQAGYARRLKQLQPHRTEERRERIDRLLALLAQARDHLLNPADKERYDAKLRGGAPPRATASPARPKPVASAASESIPWKWAVAGIVALILVGAAVTFSVVRLVSALSTPIIAQAPVDEPPLNIAPSVPPPPPSPVMPEETPPPEVAEEVANPPPSLAEMPAEPKEPESPPVAESSTPEPEPAEPVVPAPEAEPAVPLEPAEVPSKPIGARPPAPAIEDAFERAEYIAAVRDMLEIGLGKTSDRDKKAREHYERALALCDSDPRLFYGLALIVHPLQHEEAKKLLLRTMNQCAFNHPGAWRLLIHQQLKRSLDKNFLQGLLSFARRLEDVSDPWPDEAAKSEFALFLGQVVGFLQGPGGTKALAAEIAALDTKMLEVLPEAFREAYVSGKDDIRVRRELMDLEFADKVAKATATSDGEQRTADESKQKLNDDEQKLARQQEEYDAAWDKLKAEFMKDWTKLEDEYKLAVQHAHQLALHILEIESRIQGSLNLFAAQQAAARAVQGNAKPNISPPNIEPLLMQKAEANQRMNHALQYAELCAVKARQRLAQISQAEREYQAATGKLVKESGFIADARKSIDVQATKLKKAKPAAAAPRPIVRSAAELKRFSSYVPFDLQVEKERILASYEKVAAASE